MPTVPLPLPARGLRRIRLDLASSAIETALVRASVGALRDSRHACKHCRRTPLVGEHVYVYESGRRGRELVCELCRPLRTAAPDETLLVRAGDQRTVMRAVPLRT